jgi:hypothetical protein
MKKLSEDQILKNLEEFYGYINSYVQSPRKEQLLNLYKGRELVLTTAPASSKLSHHNCFPGGYLEHVNRVVKASLVLDKVWDKFDQVKDYTLEELVFCAINHDLGKLGTDEEPFYLQNDSQWHVEKQGAYYKYNTNMIHMRIADRSLFCLQEFGIAINEREFLAIKLHDGLYEESNKQYYMPYGNEFQIKTNMVYILHQADLMASRIESQINTK